MMQLLLLMMKKRAERPCFAPESTVEVEQPPRQRYSLVRRCWSARRAWRDWDLLLLPFFRVARGRATSVDWS